MNTLFSMIVVTGMEVSEAFVFSNQQDCERASGKIQNSFCAAKVN